MKRLIVILSILTTLSGYSQITRITGRVTETSTEIYSKEVDEVAKISYVANGTMIQELIGSEKSDVFLVSQVTFYPDKIFYRAKDVSGRVFGITFTFADRSLFLSDIEGVFVELSGEGLSFCHQY